MSGYEILEHTADVGVRATGATLEDVFAQATRGLAGIIGAWQPNGGEEEGVGEEGGIKEPVVLEVEADDLGGLLVDWLSEILYLHDTRDAVIAGLEVARVADGRASGTVTLAPRGDRVLEGTQVKAVTYHQLAVEKSGDEWVVTVFFDV
ncbi:MAG: archease [Actinomycetota bacterium]